MKLVLISLALLALLTAGLLAFANYRWGRGTAALVARLDGARGASSSPYTSQELKDLPDPVQRYFRAVLRDGQPRIHQARLEQAGQFLLRPTPNGWRPVTAAQYATTDPAGFVWDARIRMGPGIAVRVRDALVGGVGSMHGRIAGLIPVVAVENTPEIASGALHRYLAEAVWFPTALLPAAGVRWTAIDDSTARATLSVGATTAWLDFRFGRDSLVESVFTPARARDVDGRAVPTPWQGRFSSYEERGGVRIPTAGEVEWLLPEGPQVYWRGRLTDVAFEVAAPR